MGGISRTMLAGVAAVLLLAVRPLSAQSSDPFSTLELLLAPAVDAEIGDLVEFWRPRHGALVRLATPFYLGSAAAAFHNASYEARSVAQPDFYLRTFTIEWNGGIHLVSRLQAFGGVQAGASAMSFLEREITHNADENEFLLGLQAGLRLPIEHGFGATMIAGHRKVFTQHPLRLSYVAIGVHYSRETPSRLREVLE